MPTVYAIDTWRQPKVRYRGVVHYAGTEIVSAYSMGALAPRSEPYGARCDVKFDNAGETPAYIEDSDILVTCVACLGHRRRD